MKAALDRAIELVELQGAAVRWEKVPEEPGRYFGILSNSTLILYEGNTDFEALFTLGHLYGHLCQRARPTEEILAAIDIVSPARGFGPLSTKERGMMLFHENEAAEIGLGLCERAGADSTEFRLAYSRMFWADFTYLCRYVETGIGGPEPFAKAMAECSKLEVLVDVLYETPDFRLTPPVEGRDILVV